MNTFDAWNEMEKERKQHKENAFCSEWISVKDRLPKQKPMQDNHKILASDYVLVLIRYDDDFYWISTSAYVGDEWLADIPGEGRMVTHWMPWPKLPKEVQDGN